MLHPYCRKVLTLLTIAVLAGCSREMSRSIAPTTSSAAIDLNRSAAPNAPANQQLPQATIVSPPPDPNFGTIAMAPLRFEWTGNDPDGHLREYRYRVFGSHNPDFPLIIDFVPYLESNPQAVLSYYESVKWQGWEELPVRKDTQTSATYSTLARSVRYDFVVVAIDNRGAHDATLTRQRNILQFQLSPRTDSPSLTFVGPFGQATVASEAVPCADCPPDPEFNGVVQAPPSPIRPPFEVSWFATPQAGSVIKGYRSTFDGTGLIQPTSLADTSAILQAPPPGNYAVSLVVEVEYGDGKRALYRGYFPFSAFSAGPTAARRSAVTRN